MRAYYFGNLYLSSIQQGIQAKHCAGEMYNKYLPAPTTVGECCFNASAQTIQLMDWSNNHKTAILLSAGFSETQREIYEGFLDSDNPFPFAKFHEGVDALDGAMTCVGIILPMEIYEAAAEVRKASARANSDFVDIFNKTGRWNLKCKDIGMVEFSKWEVWLINELNKYPLAR